MVTDKMIRAAHDELADDYFWIGQTVTDGGLRAAIEAALAAAWVPVGERLPETMAEVLVHDGFHQYLLARRESDGRWRDTTESMPLDHVTHWMPLPALPKE